MQITQNEVDKMDFHEAFLRYRREWKENADIGSMIRLLLKNIPNAQIKIRRSEEMNDYVVKVQHEGQAESEPYRGIVLSLTLLKLYHDCGGDMRI